MPLIRFWKKLSKSEFSNSVEQLYSFILHNKIQITELGDVVLEKGVKQKSNGNTEDLVDCRTGQIDHSIGMYVSMPRNKVNSNPEVTCSTGLHAAPSSYVRKFYSSGIIVEIVVNPVDIVSVPVDYNSRKVRCCAYRVVGYSPKNPRKKQVVKLSDFIPNLSDITQASEKTEIKTKVNKSKVNTAVTPSGKVINIDGLKAKEIVSLVMKTIKCKKFGGLVPRKAQVIKQATKLLNAKGYSISIK